VGGCGLRNPSHSQLFFTRSLFKALNLSSLIRGWLRVCATLHTVSYSLRIIYSKHRICRVSYVGGCGLRNPSHSQLISERSLFKALNLSSLIRGWAKFAQSFIHTDLDLNLTDLISGWAPLHVPPRVCYHYTLISRHT
jgi:hypothetical protein